MNFFFKLKKNHKDLSSISSLLIFSLFTWHIIYNLHTFENWNEIQASIQGLIDGRPHWRAYQNRLLGPYTIQILSWILGSFQVSMNVFFALGILTHNLIFYFLLFRSLESQIISLLLVVTWSFLFIVLQDYWIYPWDIFEVIFFTFASYILIFENKWAHWLLLIFPIVLLNKESALFLPIGVLYVWELNKSKFFFREIVFIWVKLRSILILLMCVFGAIYTKFIRDFLFIESFYGHKDLSNQLLGNQIKIHVNIYDLVWANFFNHNLLHAIPLVVITIYFVRLFISSDDKGLRLGCAFYFTQLIAILFFGWINETRMLFPLISLILLVLLRKNQLNRQ